MKTEAYINEHKKYHGTSAVLTIFFGPLGVLYSSVMGGVLLTLLFIVSLGTIVIPFGIWIASPIVGSCCVSDYNRKLKIKAAMFSSGGFLEV